MFESVRTDPGEQGLTRASRIFFVVSVLSVLGTALMIVVDLPRFNVARTAFSLAMAGLAYVIGDGVARQRPWAKWAGFAFAAFELINFPIGTVIGIALIVYLYRANKAELFLD